MTTRALTVPVAVASVETRQEREDAARRRPEALREGPNHQVRSILRPLFGSLLIFVFLAQKRLFPFLPFFDNEND